MPGPYAQQVAVGDERLVDERPANQGDVQRALADDGYLTASENARARRDLDSVTDRRDRLVFLEEVPSDIASSH